MKQSNLMVCAGATILLLFASDLIPIAGLFLSLLTPLPFLYTMTKLGRREGLKTVGATLAIVGLIAYVIDYPQKFVFCLEFCLFGLVIAEAYQRRFTFAQTIFVGTAVLLLIGIVVLSAIGLSRNMGPMEMVLDYFQRNMNETIQGYENLGLDQDKIEQLREYTKAINEMVSKVYVALLVIGTGFVVWLNVVLSRALFRLRGLTYPDMGPTDRWRAPEHMIWGFVGSGFALFFAAGSIRWVALNVFIVLFAVYVFQGLSILLFFLNKYNVPRFLRIGVYVLIIFQQLFLIGLAVVGLFDQWFDFRKLSKTEAA